MKTTPRRTPAKKPTRAKDETAEPVAPEKKTRMTVNVHESVLDAARNATYWTPGLTVAQLVENGVRREIARLEKARGEPFPARKGEVRTGRPLKS